MQTNANRTTLKRMFMRFSRTLSVNDMRPDEATRSHRAAKFERKFKTHRHVPNYGLTLRERKDLLFAQQYGAAL